MSGRKWPSIMPTNTESALAVSKWGDPLLTQIFEIQPALQQPWHTSNNGRSGQEPAQ
jgi:hypothetical protein